MRAFICSEIKPSDLGVQPWGRFERWSDMVRAPLVWMGAKDPWTAIYPDAAQVLKKYGQDAKAPKMGNSAPAGRMRVKGPNGETGTVPEGSALPPGWVKS